MSLATMIRVALLGGLVALWPCRAVGIEADAENRKQIQAYYDRWLGVKAPELGSDAVDRTTGPAVKLSAFRGKRVLLIGFDAGDLHRLPDEPALLKTLRAVDKARKTARPEKLAVVGFTRGVIFTWPGAGKPAGELGQLTDYPIVSVTNRTFNEPYNLLAS